MRAKTLWRESPSSSICAFCAHRWGANIVRRSIHSSRIASSSEATAFATRENAETSQNVNHQASPNEIDGALTSNRARGRPAFGRRGAPASVTDFSSLLFVKDPNEGKLTEEEKWAKRLVEENANGPIRDSNNGRRESTREVVDVYGHPAPELNRAGRPEPMSEAMMNSLRESQKRKDVAMDRYTSSQGSRTTNSEAGDSPRRSISYQRDSRPEFRRFGRFSAPDDVADGGHTQHPGARNSINGQTGSWSHLIRRKDSRPSANQDAFLEGRPDREIQARAGQYTPILDQSSSPKLETSSNNEQVKEVPDSVRFHRPNFYRPAGEKLRHNSDGNRSAAGDVEERFKIPESGFVATSPRRRMPSQERRDHILEQRQLRQPAPQRWPLPKADSDNPSRFQRFEQPPNGRDRDKIRRREQFVTDDEEVEGRKAEQERAELKKQRRREKAAARAAAPTPILLPEYISVSNLATALKVRIDDFVEKMSELGFEETGHDHILNGENAGLIAMEYNFEPIINKGGNSEDLKARPEPEDRSVLPPRPPVVTIMGHVDHGKTTLLDWLRKSSVAATEHGGITQHIGAFSVPMPSGKVITFLDTPGHAAFLNMRQRGANVTDIVVLVVAADDSVKPQTIEAINHAKTAKVPIIVAINKIDKEDANIERVKQDLARFSVDVEDFGGDTQVVCVSGKTGQGMQELEEAIITLSEIVDMRAERDGPAEGWVVEASIKSVGKVATVLVRRGTMRPGDFIVAGQTWAKIRTLRNEAGLEMNEALPGTPVQIEGWREQPLAGDEVLQAPDESKAKDVVEYRVEMAEREKLAQDMEAINEDRKEVQAKREQEKKEADLAEVAENANAQAREAEQAGLKLVNFIVKGDVSGSVEAINDSISAIGNQEIQPRILRSAVGQISEFDIEHAAAASGYIINFNTPIDPYISRLAEKSGVKILDHNVIYRLCDDVKAKLSEYLPPLLSYKVLGEADIIQVFNITIKGRQQKPVAGCKVRNGTISRSSTVRVFRGGEKIFDGPLESLKNGKKDVPEMHKGNECGLGFENWMGFQEGDQVQAYETIEEKRYL